jgi:hypothetical protein
MKKLLIALLFLTACNTPYKIIETYTTDSTGKTVKTIQKLYSNNTTVVVPQASLNLYSSPLFYHYYSPRVIVPRPVYHYRRH